jgi:hypothetical protein
VGFWPYPGPLFNFHHEINTPFFSSIALDLDEENNRTRRD